MSAQVLDAGTVRFEYDRTTEGVARFLAERVDQDVRLLQRRLGAPDGAPITIRLAADADAFGAHNPSEVPEWAAGTAWPEQGLIVLRTHSGLTDPDALQRRMKHELAHVLVQRAAGDGPVPHWLTEGVAQTESGQSLLERSRLLIPATFRDRTLHLQDLTEGWPADETRARIAYAQSIELIAWLERENGPDVVARLLAELRTGQGLDSALVATVGRNLAGLDQAFRNRLTWVHKWLPILGGSGTLWVVTTVLFLVAAWKKRREKRLGMERLAAEEEDQDDVLVLRSDETWH